MSYPQLQVMRYMGNKAPLLPFIIPEIRARAPIGMPVLDLMAGTHAIGYALKGEYPIWANDVQAYSQIIGQALLDPAPPELSSEIAQAELGTAFQRWRGPGLMTKLYQDTYLSQDQCQDVDGLRLAIESIPSPRRDVYLTALIWAVCLAQNTTGHFAQFLSPNHRRRPQLAAIPIWESFLRKCETLRPQPGIAPPRITRLPTQEVLRTIQLNQVGLVYLDPPYSEAQYSRFYHLLETLILYDDPKIQHKGRYRQGRFASPFSQRSQVRGAFTELLKTIASATGAPLLISYSTSGLLPLSELTEIAQSWYHLTLLTTSHPHSTQGRGPQEVHEVLLICEK